jgi:glycosyltransferase involved in cell wall biosynthesis
MPDIVAPRMALRIGIEAWAAADVPAGRGRYVRELLRHLAQLDTPHEFVLFTRRPWDGAALGPRFRWRAIPGAGPRWVVRAGLVARRHCDVLLASTSYALCALARVPTVGVVYDLVAFDRTLGAPRGAALERLTLPVAVRAARALLCISEATRALLVERRPAAAAKAQVIPLAADEAFARARPDPAITARHGIERPYVMSAATLEPRKNLPGLIEAFAGLDDTLRDRFELVLVGAAGWRTGELDASLARHAHLVKAVGYVPDDELAALYAGAALVAYPSLAEGFGLPVLEAMAAGAPVLTSDRSSLPEVGGDAVAYADPTSVDSIRGQLETLLADNWRRAALAAAGRERAKRFSWTATATETLAAIERAAAA